MKKVVISILFFIVLCSIIVNAGSIICEISYWYSNGIKIGRWYESITFSTQGTASCPTNFTTNVSTGFGAWSSAGISNGYTTSFNDASIPVYGGPYTEIKVLNPSFSTTATGQTEIGATYIGDYMYGASAKSGYSMDNATMYIATDRASSKTYKHEAGHALGWFGHSTNSGDIMYETESSVTSLTLRDKNHLVQIY